VFKTIMPRIRRFTKKAPPNRRVVSESALIQELLASIVHELIYYICRIWANCRLNLS
jgi:hypothetical protein